MMESLGWYTDPEIDGVTRNENIRHWHEDLTQQTEFRALDFNGARAQWNWLTEVRTHTIEGVVLTLDEIKNGAERFRTVGGVDLQLVLPQYTTHREHCDIAGGRRELLMAKYEERLSAAVTACHQYARFKRRFGAGT